MRIAVDGRALRPDANRRRGVARYLRAVLEAVAEVAPEDEYVVVVPGRSDPEPFRGPNIRLVRTRVPGRLVYGAAALAGRPRLDRWAGGCDLVWLPAPAPVAVSPGLPMALTLHDLSFEHPSDFTPYERVWHRVARPGRLVRRAQRVICVSTPVRDAALARWRLDPTRLRVVPSGPGRPPGPAGELPPGVPERFVLAVGALEPRKAPGLLADAHARAAARGLEAGLVFAGHGPLAAELARSGATVVGHVPDPVLEALYARALVLVCASRDEGFGFTPLEALARGTPAIVADLPVFAETLGDGALRVPPGDAGALADALLRVERDPGLRERLASLGGEAVARLSWERTARETRSVLAEAAS